MNVPAHVHVRAETVRTLACVCTHCQARAFIRDDDTDDAPWVHADRLLTEWLTRHQHDTNPTEGEPQ